MKKMIKKSSLLVVLLMVMVLSLSGCSGKKDTKEPVNSTIPSAAVVQMKSITVEVVNEKGESKSYNIKSDAGLLFDAIKATEGLTLDGSVGDYGYYITAVNGIRADYDKDQAYWALYVNGEYGQTSIETQPIADGDTFKLVYEKAKSE